MEPASRTRRCSGSEDRGNGQDRLLPSISLPKGGGAIRGIDQKFQVNPATGTGAQTIPLPMSPGRGDSTPTLSLTYDSGAGNSPFGLGWRLGVPSISRKTDKGLPRYRDARDSDTFILSGAEDLVPALRETEEGWVREALAREENGIRYRVDRYLPRIEGLFARIERWTDAGSGEVHWRSVDQGNVRNFYGRGAASRVAEPGDPTRVFEWLLEETRDDKGNVVRYEHKREDGAGVARSSPHEKNRLANGSSVGNTYLKRVRYGNRTPVLAGEPAPAESEDWLFEVLLDYGEHTPGDGSELPAVAEIRPWAVRPDVFSTFRPGFDVRTYRLCRRFLMVHRFEELNDGEPTIVRSLDLTYDENPVATRLIGVTLRGFRRDEATGSIASRAFPAVEFTYTPARVDPTVHTLDRESLENLPAGLDDSRYRFVDLDGEGLSGVLSELDDAWYYKRNLGDGRFGSKVRVAGKPSLAAVGRPRQRLTDLAGDGTLDVALLSEPTPGYYERSTREEWEAFVPFESRPNLDWADPNLRLVDLTGDGRADVLVTEAEVFLWYPSLGEEGFGDSETVHLLDEEEADPRVVFADATLSIYLADMSGDGLSDVVRLRNGEVCYWPNRGYGRFGAKITMGQAPVFDPPDLFSQRRIRLADVDGSGTTDVLYLGRDKVSFWFNQSGNSFSERHDLDVHLPIDDLASVSVTDLLGNGTAHLVWSSPLPADAGQPLKYVDLMGGVKPHLLDSVTNGLGAQTRIRYAPSTKFYLADREAGKPWITRLPFPVHVVERVEAREHVTRSKWVTEYVYHHGHFDGHERELRGFGMVEQRDTESFRRFAGRGLFTRPPEVEGEEYHLPPVLTKTWFHTGAHPHAHTLAELYAEEYYRGDEAAELLPDAVVPAGLTPEEIREAYRALKGAVLRTETYALDGTPASEHPYAVTESTNALRRLQPRQGKLPAAFLPIPRETLTYQYERDPDDPRIRHALTLEVDDFGNVTRSAAVGYPRRSPASGAPPHPEEQTRLYVTCTESRFANVADREDRFRIGVPVEVETYELTGVGGPSRLSVEQLRELAASAAPIPYEAEPGRAGPEKRLVEHVRTLYLADDPGACLPLGEVESLALPCRSYTLAFTRRLLRDVFGDRVDDALLRDEGRYLQGADLKSSGLFPAGDSDTDWWIPSGRPFFQEDPSRPDAAFARAHFYLLQGVEDPFGGLSRVTYDGHDLLAVATRDPLGNTVRAEHDYRTLRPRLVTDPNGNRSQVAFDALGMIAGTAVMGKEAEDAGDSLEGIVPDLDEGTVRRHLADPLGREPGGAPPQTLLGNATTRLLYDVERNRDLGEPVAVSTLARETHVSEIEPGDPPPGIRHGFLYSDGWGREAQTKVRAEPGDVPCLGLTGVDPRWAGTGRTVYDNKGNPIKQYEPFFSATHLYETEPDLVECGVTPILRYDPLGRLVRTDHPDGTFSRVDLSPWEQKTWDANDTVLESEWYRARGSPDPGGAEPGRPDQQERRAAYLAAQHAETPSTAVLDTLGRIFLSLSDNKDDHLYRTHKLLDVEGNLLLVTDDRGNPVMDYRVEVPEPGGVARRVPGYDVAGRQLYLKSMDAGERRLLLDVAGNPIRRWDSRGQRRRYRYDALQRPTHLYVQSGEGGEVLAERTLYGDGGEAEEPETRNLRGRVFRVYDGAGVVTNEAFDFKGNLLHNTRRLAREHREVVDWSLLDLFTTAEEMAAAAEPLLEGELFEARSRFDALDRPVSVTTPDGSETLPRYNEANLLEAVSVRLRGAGDSRAFVANVDYNARGQRVAVDYGIEGVRALRTELAYDDLTFRLTRLRTVRGPGSDLQDLRYTYDSAGNVTHVRDDAQQTVYFRNRVVRPDAGFKYDPLYRLVEATGREHAGLASHDGPEHRPELKPQYDFNDVTRRHHAQPSDGRAMQSYTRRYAYDPVGNVLGFQHLVDGAPLWVRRHDYEATDNRLRSTGLPGDPAPGDADALPDRYTYDAHGNMTSMPHLPVMEWDFKDQLQVTQRQEVASGVGAERTYYVYDATGQRARKVTHRPNGSRRNERIYLGGYEIFREYAGDGTEVELERETLHVMDGQRRIALVETKTLDVDVPALPRTPRIRYQIDNHLGSSCLELAGSGEIISYEEYYPYGSTSYQAARTDVEVSAKRYRYTGMERDEESGLNYHTARYYASWLGRWCSADPAGSVDGWNLYRYTRNSPVGSTDTNGKDPPDDDDSPDQRRVRAQRRALGEARLQREAEIGEEIRVRRLQADLERLLGYPDTTTIRPNPAAATNTRPVVRNPFRLIPVRATPSRFTFPAFDPEELERLTTERGQAREARRQRFGPHTQSELEARQRQTLQRLADLDDPDGGPPRSGGGNDPDSGRGRGPRGGGRPPDTPPQSQAPPRTRALEQRSRSATRQPGARAAIAADAALEAADLGIELVEILHRAQNSEGQASESLQAIGRRTGIGLVVAPLIETGAVLTGQAAPPTPEEAREGLFELAIGLTPFGIARRTERLTERLIHLSRQ